MKIGKCYIANEFIYAICSIIVLVVIIIFMIRGCISAIDENNRKLIENAKLQTKQEGEAERKRVFYEENHGFYYLVDIPIDGKRHQYLIHRPGNYNSESMTHYPECKYCKERKNK